MKAIALAWRVSKPWMRVTVIVILVVVILNIFAAFEHDTVTQDLSPPKNSAASLPKVDFEGVKTTATHTCWDAILASATNRSSVEFHSLTAPPVVRKMTDGRLDVFVKFSAKNGFGSESTSIARCVVSADGGTLSEITAQESR